MAMPKAKLVKRLKSFLGYPVVDLYVTDDMIEDMIDMCVDEFSSAVFNKQIRVFPKASILHLNPNEVAFIVRVQDVGFKGRSSVVGDAAMSAPEFSLFSTDYFYLPEGSLSGYFQAKTLFNQYKNVSGDKLDFKYDSTTGDLYISNIPRDCQYISVVMKTYHTLESITEFYNDFFTRFILAHVKIAEGRIRSKYSVQVGTPQDGQVLIDQGREDLATLRQEMSSFISYDFGVRA